MITGCKYWNDKDRLYIQERAAWEQVLPGLQMCGPTAAGNIRAALVDRDEGVNGFGGAWAERPADALATYFATPANWPELQNIRTLPLGWGAGQFPPWEIPQYYPIAVKKVFGLDAEFKYGVFSDVVNELLAGNGVQLCLKVPGHYIAAIAYDDQAKKICFKDPWSGDRWPGNSVTDENGNKWFGAIDYANVQPWYIVIKKPE